MNRVGFVGRFLAVLIDAVAICILLFILTMVFGVSIGTMMMGAGTGADGVAIAGAGASLFILVILAAVPIAYSLLEVLMAATPGKMALGMRIKNADGSPASKDVLAKRWAIKNSSQLFKFLATILSMSILGTLSTIAGLVIFVGCFLSFRENKQALHDIVAKTAVYK